MKNIKRYDNTQFGCAINGLSIGSGWNITIKRESDCVALINVCTPSESEDFLGELEVLSDSDLHYLAKAFGQNPSPQAGGYTEVGDAEFGYERMVSFDDPGWDDLADRWNRIKVRY